MNSSFQTRINETAARKADAQAQRDSALEVANRATSEAHAAYAAEYAEIEKSAAAASGATEAAIASETSMALAVALKSWTTEPRQSAAEFAKAARKAMARCADETGAPLSWLVVAIAMAREYDCASRIVHKAARSFAGDNMIGESAMHLLSDLEKGAPDVIIRDDLTALEIAIARTGARQPECPGHLAIANSIASDRAMREALMRADDEAGL